MPIRVLVVDDSAFMRKALSAIIESDGGLELVGTAFNGRNALEKIARLRPDVVTMDVEMPELDGLAALKELMAGSENPPAVLMCSSLTKDGSRVAVEALAHGAADVIAKPTTAVGLHESPDGKQLLAKIRGVARHRRQFQRQSAMPKPVPTLLRPGSAPRSVRIESLPQRRYACLVIGSSTGGPPALERVLGKLPPSIGVPIVVAQHMPQMFTKSMAERLDGLTALNVVHAETGMPLLPGTVYIGQGGRHIRVARVAGGRARVEISSSPETEIYRPSVNVLFESAAAIFGNKTLAIMLTGMGEDGVRGARPLAEAGGVLLGQDEASSVVYGMPRAVAEAGYVTAQMPPDELGRAVAYLTDQDRVQNESEPTGSRPAA